MALWQQCGQQRSPFGLSSVIAREVARQNSQRLVRQACEAHVSQGSHCGRTSLRPDLLDSRAEETLVVQHARRWKQFKLARSFWQHSGAVH